MPPDYDNDHEEDLLLGSGLGTAFVEVIPHGGGYSKVVKQQSIQVSTAPINAAQTNEVQTDENQVIVEVEAEVELEEENDLKKTSVAFMKATTIETWETIRESDTGRRTVYLVAAGLVSVAFLKGLILTETIINVEQKPFVHERARKKKRRVQSNFPTSSFPSMGSQNFSESLPDFPPLSEEAEMFSTGTADSRERAPVGNDYDSQSVEDLDIPIENLIPQDMLDDLEPSEREELMEAMRELEDGN